VYVLKAWLWQVGRCKARMGGLSVADNKDRQIAVLKYGAKLEHFPRRQRPCPRPAGLHQRMRSM
jgi:hypothetical protein